MFAAVCLFGTVALMSNTTTPEEKMEEEFVCSSWVGVNTQNSDGFYLCRDNYTDAELFAEIDRQLSIR